VPDEVLDDAVVQVPGHLTALLLHRRSAAPRHAGALALQPPQVGRGQPQLEHRQESQCHEPDPRERGQDLPLALFEDVVADVGLEQQVLPRVGVDRRVHLQQPGVATCPLEQVLLSAQIAHSGARPLGLEHVEQPVGEGERLADQFLLVAVDDPPSPVPQLDPLDRRLRQEVPADRVVERRQRLRITVPQAVAGRLHEGVGDRLVQGADVGEDLVPGQTSAREVPADDDRDEDDRRSDGHPDEHAPRGLVPVPGHASAIGEHDGSRLSGVDVGAHGILGVGPMRGCWGRTQCGARHSRCREVVSNWS
jgi:hypothetical protein